VLEEVNARQPSPFAIDTTDTEGTLCRSDHVSYARFWIPVVFITTGSHVDYHAITDEAQYIDYPGLTRVARLVRDITLTLAASDPALLPTTGRPPRAVCGS